MASMSVCDPGCVKTQTHNLRVPASNCPSGYTLRQAAPLHCGGYGNAGGAENAGIGVPNKMGMLEAIARRLT